MENQYLNEEKYQKTKRKITIVAALLLVIGLCIGGFLIYKGIAKPSLSKLDELKAQLEMKKSELEAKGIKYNILSKYTDGEEYDLKIITNALDPSFSYCHFDEYKSNALTKEYCAIQNSNDDFSSTGSKMLGVFICIATCMISGFIFLITKQRDILAFQQQQAIPVVKETVNEMTPTVGNVAKEVAKGIKEGLEDKE